MHGTLAETVAVAPRCGLIYPRGHQILTLWSNPTEDSPGQEFSIHLQLNGAENAMVQYTELTTQIKQTFLMFNFETLLGVDSCHCDAKTIYVSGS